MPRLSQNIHCVPQNSSALQSSNYPLSMILVKIDKVVNRSTVQNNHEVIEMNIGFNKI